MLPPPLGNCFSDNSVLTEDISSDEDINRKQREAILDVINQYYKRAVTEMNEIKKNANLQN